MFNFVSLYFVMELSEKQIEILTVAEKLFAAKGFDGTSVRDISHEAAVNVAMISYYFGSKEKLLENLIIHRTQDLRMKLENIFAENGSPFQKIDQYIKLYIEKIDSNRHLFKIMHFEISMNKRVMDFEAFNEIKKKNLQSLTKIIEEGQNQNLFSKTVNIPLITPTILGTYFHFYSNRIFYQEELALNSDASFDQYVKIELTNHIQNTIKALLKND